MRFYHHLWRLIGCLVVLVVSIEARADLCDKPQMIAEAAKFTQEPGVRPGSPIPKCHAKFVPYLDADGSHLIQVAWILREAKWDFDMWATRWDAFAMLPGDELLALGRYRAVPVPSLRAMGFALDGLDINAAQASGICCFKFDLMFDATLEKRAGRLCVIYRMKPPFLGEFIDCDGYDKPTGEAQYGPGAISWDDAREIGCGTWKIGRKAQLCGVLATTLEQASDGTLFWKVPVRSKVRVVNELNTPAETPIHFEVHTYRVDVVGGKRTLLSYEDQPVPGEQVP